MSDFRDVQHGVNDPVDGVDVKRRFSDNQTPHERAQFAADVRSNAVPAADEEFLPEASAIWLNLRSARYRWWKPSALQKQDRDR
jgi:hypothetical protein